MLLVADSGSTKADWSFIHQDGATKMISTKGFNPVFHDSKYILEELDAQFSQRIQPGDVKEIHYYGSGCWDQDRKLKVKKALVEYFPNASYDIQHDLEGAARATCGNSPGISCILGTGSNSCLFDGNQVIDNVTNLGFLLGDEGSGSHLGKHLIRAYFYRELPADLEKAFQKEFPDGKKMILDKIYGKPSPNVYLASLARLLAVHDDHPFIKDLVQQSLAEFLDRHVAKYEGYQTLPIHFVGSIAYHFGDILQELLQRRGLYLGKIIKKPINALVDYHLNHSSKS